jgi:hypothetical protein
MQGAAKKTTRVAGQALEDEVNDFTYTLDGFDEAIIGIDMVSDPPRVIYDTGTIIMKLIDEHGMTVEGAMEYYEFNIFNLHIGAGTPILCDPVEGKAEIDDIINQLYGL